MAAYETLPIQIRYISSTSTIDGNPIDPGQLLLSVSLTSTSTVTAPYYNFSAKADWYQFLSGTIDQTAFTNWIGGMVGTQTIANFTYVESTTISQWGQPIGEISCDLTYDGKGNPYEFLTYFYEINGIGINIGDNTNSVRINSNNNLSYINCYYGGLKTGYLEITNNLELQYIDGNLFSKSFCYSTIEISNNWNLKEIINFTKFPDDITNFQFNSNITTSGPNEPTIPIEFNYSFNNCSLLVNITINYNNIVGIDWSIIEDCNSLTALEVQGSTLQTFNPISLPNSIATINLGGNQLNQFKPKMLPSSLVNLILTNNKLSEFNLEFDFPSTCPNLSSLQLTYNYLSKWNQGLPSSIYGLILDNNQFFSFDGSSLTSSISYISLQNNPLQSFPTGISQCTYLGGLFLQNTNMTNCNVNTAGLVGLTSLDLSYCNIVNLNIEDSGNITNLQANNNKLQKLTFSNVSLINTMNLSFNPIVSFDTDLKTYTPNLYNLSYSNWTSIESWTASIPTPLNYIFLNSTPLKYFNPNGGLNEIFYLYLPDNKLSSFDVDLTGNAYLTDLILSNNLITEWNQSLGNVMSNFVLGQNVSLKTVVTNIPSTLNTLDLVNCSINSVLLTGTKIPNTLSLTNNEMTTASWNAMNPWALTLTPGSGTFNASGNVNTITGTTLQTTLVSKGVTVNA
jgi:hypothetical protein